jgi:hypothetical protein
MEVEGGLEGGGAERRKSEEGRVKMGNLTSAF